MTAETHDNDGNDDGNGKKKSQLESYEDLGPHHLTAPEDINGRQPHDRVLRFSRRENSEFKWRHEETVVGALEVRGSPRLDIHAPMKKHHVSTGVDDFHACMKIFDETNVRASFIKAFESIPPATKCCGLIPDDDTTVKNVIPIMNKKWTKAINDKTEWKDTDYYIDLFIWKWSNPTGKAETVIPMIRFHKSK